MKILEPILDKKTEKVDKTEPWRWKRNHESSNRSEPINRTWPAGSLPRASSEITGKYPHESRFGSSIPRTACDASLLKLPFSHSEYSRLLNPASQDRSPCVHAPPISKRSRRARANEHQVPSQKGRQTCFSSRLRK